MSRTAIAISIALFLVVAFCLATVDSVLESRTLDTYSAGFLMGRTLAAFAGAGVIPLIIWAVLRFNRQSALVPMAIWGGLVVMFAGVPIVVHYAKPILSSALEIPSVKQGFRGSFTLSTQKACVSSTQSAKIANFTDAQIEAYCRCFAMASADGVSNDEMADLMQGANNVPPPLRAKLQGFAKTCMAQTRQSAP